MCAWLVKTSVPNEKCVEKKAEKEMLFKQTVGIKICAFVSVCCCLFDDRFVTGAVVA